MLPNISSKSNQTMKFGQVMECNVRNNFLKKIYRACGGKLVEDPFIKIRTKNIPGSEARTIIKCCYLSKLRSTKLYQI